jgi:hypothetical protein
LRIDAVQQSVQAFGSAGVGDAVQPAAERLVGPWAGKQAAGQRPIVEAGAADEDRQPASLMNTRMAAAASRAYCAAV